MNGYRTSRYAKNILFWFAVIFMLVSAIMFVLGSTRAQQIVAHYRSHGTALLPDAHVTPGKVRDFDKMKYKSLKAEVCDTHRSTKEDRHTTEAMKRQVYAAYGVKPHEGICKPSCEADHLISLELGGADDVSNLWPQPPDAESAPGWQAKDKLENYLHKQVCSSEITLAVAQAEIATDWYDLYLKMEAEKNKPN